MILKYTKYPCILCIFESRAKDKHFVQKIWVRRSGLEAGIVNVTLSPLVETLKILLPLLHIKLDLANNNFIRALGTCRDL